MNKEEEDVNSKDENKMKEKGAKVQGLLDFDDDDDD